MHHLQHCAEKRSTTTSLYFQQQGTFSYHEAYKIIIVPVKNNCLYSLYAKTFFSPAPLVNLMWFWKRLRWKSLRRSLSPLTWRYGKTSLLCLWKPEAINVKGVTLAFTGQGFFLKKRIAMCSNCIIFWCYFKICSMWQGHKEGRWSCLSYDLCDVL